MGDIQKISIYIGKRLSCCILEFLSLMVSLLVRPKRSAIPAIRDDILTTPAVKLSLKIKSGELTSEEVVKAFIDRIKLVNPSINAVVDLRHKEALKDARLLDHRLQQARSGNGDQHLLELPLVGVPFTVKETIALKGAPFTAGLARRKFKRASQSNEAVDQLINAGLIPIGSTNTPCMNLWWDSYNLLYGRTNNPYDLSRIPGGSSGGEASLQAAAGSVVGVGSDLAGSIRIPCSFCGIFGHKPTPFVVSNNGVYPSMRMEQEKLRGVGPMTRYACDLLPMLKIMLKQPEVSKMKLDEPVDLRKIKIFYLDDIGDPFVSKCNSEIVSGLHAAVQHLRSTYGVPAERVLFDEFKYGLFLWSAELNVAGGTLYTTEHEDGRVPFNPYLELIKSVFGSSEFPLNTIVTVLLEKLSSKHKSRSHDYLTKRAADLRKKFYELVGERGVLLMPSHPQPAAHHKTTIFKFLNVAFTAVGNVLQAPITQCPLGMSNEGLPFGLQVIAGPYNDRITLAVAQELSKVFGGWQPVLPGNAAPARGRCNVR